MAWRHQVSGIAIIAGSTAVALAIIVVSLVFLGTRNEVAWGLIGVALGGIIATTSQWLIARSDRHHQLRMAALDRRLQAHQEAYALWKKLITHSHKKDEIGDVVLECQDWWYTHCLFLTPGARQAFYAAYHAAHNHAFLVEARNNPDMVKQNWRDISAAGEAIERGVDLPPVGSAETPLETRSQDA